MDVATCPATGKHLRPHADADDDDDDDDDGDDIHIMMKCVSGKMITSRSVCLSVCYASSSLFLYSPLISNT